MVDGHVTLRICGASRSSIHTLRSPAYLNDPGSWMIERYKRVAHIALVVFGASTLVAAVTGSNTNPPLIAGWTMAISGWTAIGFFVKAKGRSTSLALFLAIFSGIGLITLPFLDDLSEGPNEIACPSCGAKNLPRDSKCRLCDAPLEAQLSHSDSSRPA